MASTAEGTPQRISCRIRSSWRNTFLYASHDRETVLGGLLATPGMSNANLYSMVEIICSFTTTFCIRDDREQLVENNAHALTPGDYYVFTNGSITVTDKAPLFRQISMQTGIRVAAFCEAVRNRDERCVVTGRPAVLDGVTFWRAFEAAHVFPLKYEGCWESSGLRDCITIPPTSESHGTINSVQNGILLTRDMHALFDSYEFSINPSERHMIVCFTPLACSYGIAGAHLDERFLDDPLRPPDELFSWHFRQAVLVNMKGAGEASYEMEFQPGPGQITNNQKAGEKMEFSGLGTPIEVGACA